MCVIIMNIVKPRGFFFRIFTDYHILSVSLVPDLSDLTSHICSAILNMFGVEGCFTPVREISDQSELSAQE